MSDRVRANHDLIDDDGELVEANRLGTIAARTGSGLVVVSWDPRHTGSYQYTTTPSGDVRPARELVTR